MIILFYPQSAFYPWPAVCSLHFTPSLHFTAGLQSAFYTDLKFTENILKVQATKEQMIIEALGTQIVEQRINSEVLIIVLLKPMNNPLGVSPSKGKQGLSSTTCIIYTSELILCSTICVPTRHNIHMYPYFLFAAIHHLKSSPSFSVRPCSSVGRVTVDLIRRSWVQFPPRSKDFFFASCGTLFPFTRANSWV